MKYLIQYLFCSLLSVGEVIRHRRHNVRSKWALSNSNKDAFIITKRYNLLISTKEMKLNLKTRFHGQKLFFLIMQTIPRKERKERKLIFNRQQNYYIKIKCLQDRKFIIKFMLKTLTTPIDSFLLRRSSRSIWLRCSIINVLS